MLFEYCYLFNGMDRGFFIMICNRYCLFLYLYCRRELFVNVIGELFLIFDVDDDFKKLIVFIEIEYGSIISVIRDYFIEKMEVEFLGDWNIFIYVDL